MNDYSDFTKEELLRFAKFLGFGFYRVNYEGQFMECDPKAREIFGIPNDEKDLSGYSITGFYVVPAERELRLKKLMKTKNEPVCSTLSMRINGKNKLLFDIGRYDDTYQDQENFVSLVSEIEESTIFPKMFDAFPMGLYEVDDKNKIVRVNKKMLEIFGYKNEEDILKTDIKNLYEDEADEEKFTSEIKKKGPAHGILKLKDASNKILDIECFSQNIPPHEKARWGMMTDVTRRERYNRALDRMPTGYFYIENECIKQCNDQFVKIQGFKDKEATIGFHTKGLFADEKAREKYFEDLKKKDEQGEALHNYEFQLERVNDGKILTVSVDSHLVKDTRGKVVGVQGTVRDITEQKALEKQAKEARNGLVKTETETHKFIHTLFHPVFKFTGKSKLLYQGLDILNQTMQPVPPPGSYGKELAEELMTRLIQIRDNLREHDEIDPLLAVTLEEKLTKIINVFDFTLKMGKDQVILDSKTYDAALWILEELKRVNYFQQNNLKSIIKKDFIEFLQGILFTYLKQNAEILVGETEMMNRRVESIRTFISLEKERQYLFAKNDIKKILEENIQLFKPILLEKNIKVEDKFQGDLNAVISKQDIDRVISNLFLNVRDYSYKGEGRYVKVKARELHPQNQVEISIENFGLPIKKEEITSGDIFKFGYRGAFAFKGNRDGLGAGLADALNVIKAHGGEISITSKPVEDDSSPPRYQVPYLTKVNLKIPKKQK